MRELATNLYQRITNFGLAFMLAVSSFAVVGPFIAAQDAMALTTVNSQAELEAAIAGSDTLIELGSSFTISSQVNINRSVVINGNGHTVSAQAGWSGSPSNDSILAVTGGNPTISNLTIEGTNGVNLQGLQVWQSAATLSKVISRNNDKTGIHVNSSAVTATDIETASNGLFFGGVMISGTGVITVNGESKHSESGAAIWQEGSPGLQRVDDSNLQYDVLTIPVSIPFLGIKAGKIYTLKSAPGAPVFEMPTPAHNSTITDTQTVTVAWSKPSYASTFEYRINEGSPVATGDQSFTQNFVNGNYDIEVRSVAASGLKGDWSVVRSFTMSYYSYNVNDSKFVSSPKYIQANGAHASHNISAEVHVPQLTDDVVFSVDGGDWIPGTYVNTVNSSLERWRLITPLAPGEYVITAQYRVNGVWYDVTGSGVVYSLDSPTAQYVSPSLTSNMFRGEDNPVRLKVEDQYEQFSRMVVTIGSSSYEVLRGDCDLRQAGNYLLCDVDQSASWGGLASGVYTASTTTYTKANNRVDNLVSLPFTVDNDKPVITSFSAPEIVSSVLAASATATDHNGVESINFFITEPRVDGVCTGNGAKLLESRVFTMTAGAYNVSLDTSSLDGEYCLSVRARDNAKNNSTILHKKIVIDNTNPVVEVTSVNVTLGNNKELSFDLKATDENSGLSIVAANIYDATNTNLIVSLGSGSPTRLNDPHSGLAVGTGLFETSVSGIDVSSLASGTYTIRAFARDHANNERRFLLTQFTVDNDKPTVTINALTTTDETPTLTGDVDDITATVVVSIDGTDYPAVNNGDGTWTLVLTTPLAIGSYTAVVTATDTAGNADSATANITVQEIVVEENDPETEEDDIVAPQTIVTPDEDVLGDQDDQTGDENDQNIEEDESGVEAATDDKTGDSDNNILGLAWYWWLLILAALAAAAWWLIGAYRRRNAE